MELESDCCLAPTPVDEKEEFLGKTSEFDEIKVDNNGSCANEIGNLGSGEPLEVKTSVEIYGKDVGIEKPLETPSNVNESPSGVPGVTSPPTKGYGLKKWRRIRRDFTKDGGSGVDLNRILKRGLSNAVELGKSRDLSSEIKQKSEGSVVSANSSVKCPGVPSGFATKGSSWDSRLAVGSAFLVGMDFENSEDHSSKSSTAASALKSSYEIPIVMGSTRDKSKAKNLSGKSLGNAVQRAQQGKGRIETSKKLRGERVKIEEDNSYSSEESDLRSSNIVFTEMGSFSVISNGRQSEGSSNHNGENSYEAHASEPESSEEVQTDYCKENGGENEDASQDDVAAEVSWEAKEEESDNHQQPTGWDPLVESIILLQAVQEALEKEIQNFGEIGKEPISLPDVSTHHLSLSAEFGLVDPEIHEPNSSLRLHSEEMEKSCSLPMEGDLIKLNQKVNFLERKLEEVLATVEAKESRVVELEDILNKIKLPEKESGSTLLSLHVKLIETEIELEGLFKQKIEAEVEYLAIKSTTQKLKVAAEDQIDLVEEQKSLVKEQSQILHKLRDAESNVVVLRRRGEELEASRGELLGTREVLKMQNRVCKHTLLIFAQLILLILVFGLFLLQLLPPSSGVVPT